MTLHHSTYQTHLVDQVTRLFDQAQHFAQITAPFIQCLISSLLLLEINDPGRTINLCLDRLVRHELAKRSFGGIGAKVEELGKAGERYLRVV
jgi:hypothetical protein